MAYFIGVDIGTFESKGVMTDARGTIIARATRPHEMIVPRPGWAEHRPEQDWWGDFTVIARSLLVTSGVAAEDIQAVAASAIGPCMLPLDADGTPLMNGVLYGVDTRAVAEIAALTEKIGSETLLARCNSSLTSQSVGPKILWLKNRRPDLYAKARMFTSAAPYITFRLTGVHAMDHFTAAGFTPLYDPAKQAWSDEFARGILDPGCLPRLLWSSEIAGRVTQAAAAETGLAVGTPVVCGTIDAAAEALSVGVAGAGDMMVMYGSTIFIIQITAEQVRDPRLWYAPWLFEGLHTSQAGLATSGTLTRWFASEIYRDLPAGTVLGAMAEDAARSPLGAKGLIVLPYFSGERTPIHDPQAKGVFFGLDLTHSRADLYRGALEGIGYAVRHIVETFEAAGHPPTRLVAVGGGTKNPVWLGAVSDIAGRPQVLRQETTGASLGDAFLAALATGHAQRTDIEQWNKAANPREPQGEPVKSLYDRQYAIYRALYDRNRDLMATLSGFQDHSSEKTG